MTNIAPSGLTVITHNGQLPSEGGLRIAFQANSCAGFVSIPCAYKPIDQAIADWRRFGTTYPELIPPPPPEPVKIILATLPATIGYWCPVCDCTVEHAPSKVINTDIGRETVYTCPTCSVVFRKTLRRL